MLTMNEVRLRVRLALELDQIGELDMFNDAASALFTDLIRALAYGRCEAPRTACRTVALLLCLEADDRLAQ